MVNDKEDRKTNEQPESSGSRIPQLIKPFGIAPTETNKVTKEYLQLQREQWKREEFNQRSLFLGIIRDIRAESQNLRNSLLEIKKLQVESGGTYCTVETVAIHKKIYTYNHQQIDSCIREIRVLVDQNPGIHSEGGDEVTYIENIWERLTYIWPDFEKPPANHLAVIEKCIVYLCDIIYHCNLVTIPPRLKEHLETLRSGHYLDFYDTFKDEICEESDGTRILKYLSRHAAYIDGIIDVSQGRVYYANPKKSPVANLLILAGALIFGGLLVISGIGLVAGTMSFTRSGMSAYFGTKAPLYAIMVCGAIVHVVIGAVKQMRSATDNSFMALDDWFVWINIKLLSILGSIAILLLGFALMVTTFAQTDMLTFFIAGYSIDSLGDLFLTRFDTIVSTKTGDLKKIIS